MSKCWEDGVLRAVRAQRRGAVLNPGNVEVRTRNTLVDCMQRETVGDCAWMPSNRVWPTEKLKGAGLCRQVGVPLTQRKGLQWGVGRGRDENREWGRAGMSCTSSLSVSSSFQITKDSTKQCSSCSPFKKIIDMVFVLKSIAQWGRQTWVKNNGTNEESVIEKHIWKLLHMKGNVLSRPSRMEHGRGIKGTETQRLQGEWGWGELGDWEWRISTCSVV